MGFTKYNQLMDEFKKGSLIYTPFKKRENVFVISSGYVLASPNDDNAKRRIHLIYGPASYFPVITTFKNSEQRASYEALTDVKIQTYSVDEFIKRIDVDHDFCKSILYKTVDQLSQFADRVIDLQQTKLEDRLLNRLEVLLKQHGEKIDVGTRLPYSLKHHHLADMLGVERESITRALSRLKSKGIVMQDKEGILTINKQ